MLVVETRIATTHISRANAHATPTALHQLTPMCPRQRAIMKWTPKFDSEMKMLVCYIMTGDVLFDTPKLLVPWWGDVDENYRGIFNNATREMTVFEPVRIAMQEGKGLVVAHISNAKEKKN
jgi:hypothetical protein